MQPFEGANIEQSALDFTSIDPGTPFRQAITEAQALDELFRALRKEIREQNCTRAILVGPMPTSTRASSTPRWSAAASSAQPLPPVSFFDTATLSGLAYGQTVLAKACAEAGISFDNSEAHSAAYDAEHCGAVLQIVNRWKECGGWTPDFSGD